MTKPGEGFGFSISGGVNGYSGNPFDETDEGIFISQVPWLARGLVLHIVFCIQTKNSSQCNCATAATHSSPCWWQNNCLHCEVKFSCPLDLEIQVQYYCTQRSYYCLLTDNIRSASGPVPQWQQLLWMMRQLQVLQRSKELTSLTNTLPV